MRTDWVAEEVWTLIFLLIVALIVLVVSNFMLGYNMPESDWWKAMYTTPYTTVTNPSTLSNTISATNVEDNKTGRVSDDVRF